MDSADATCTRSTRRKLARHLGKFRTTTLRWDSRGLTVNGQRVSTVEVEPSFGDLRLDLDRPVRSARFDPERLAAVAAAAGTHSVRYALNGVNFDFTTHCLVASDGARLHASNGDTLSCSGLGPDSVIVPTGAARRMAELRMGELRTDGNVVVGLGEGLTLRTYAVDGDFPDYRPLLRPGPALIPVRLATTALEALRIADSMGRRSKLTQAGIEIPARPGCPDAAAHGRHASGRGSASPGEWRWRRLGVPESGRAARCAARGWVRCRSAGGGGRQPRHRDSRRPTLGNGTGARRLAQSASLSRNRAAAAAVTMEMRLPPGDGALATPGALVRRLVAAGIADLDDPSVPMDVESNRRARKPGPSV